ALLRSDTLSVPAVVGVLRPAIIVPERIIDTASTAIVDAALLHELSHVRRGDSGWNLARKLVEIVYWPHPLTWLLGRVLGQVRDQACDDVCVHGLGSAHAYRASLLEVASGLVRRPGPALGLAMARARTLGQRLAWIDETRGASRCVLGWPARWSLGALVAAVAVTAGAVELSQAKARATEPQPRPGA